MSGKTLEQLWHENGHWTYSSYFYDTEEKAIAHGHLSPIRLDFTETEFPE